MMEFRVNSKQELREHFVVFFNTVITFLIIIYQHTLRIMTVVDNQIDAYNNQDIEKFLECYTDNIQVFMLEQGKMITEGKDQLRNIMSSAFEANPNSKTTLVSRMVQSNLIVDHEKITGHETGKVILSIAIYEITNNKISKLWFGGRSTEEL